MHRDVVAAGMNRAEWSSGRYSSAREYIPVGSGGDVGGLVYHVLNRAAARVLLFLS